MPPPNNKGWTHFVWLLVLRMSLTRFPGMDTRTNDTTARAAALTTGRLAADVILQDVRVAKNP